MEEPQNSFVFRAFVLVALLIGIAFLWEKGFLAPRARLPEPGTPSAATVLEGTTGRLNPEPISEDDDAVLGDLAAPVTIVEFGDFDCASCRVFFKDIQPLLFEAYIRTGKANLVFRDYPITSEVSVRAAQAAECAGAQGFYWAYAERLMQESLAAATSSDAYFNEEARQLPMDQSAFTACMASGEYRDEVARDAADAQLHGITTVPVFAVNGVLLTGGVTWEMLQAEIEKALAPKTN